MYTCMHATLRTTISSHQTSLCLKSREKLLILAKKKIAKSVVAIKVASFQSPYAKMEYSSKSLCGQSWPILDSPLQRTSKCKNNRIAGSAVCGKQWHLKSYYCSRMSRRPTRVLAYTLTRCALTSSVQAWRSLSACCA